MAGFSNIRSCALKALQTSLSCSLSALFSIIYRYNTIPYVSAFLLLELLTYPKVGFYQTMKISITPVVAMIEVVFLHYNLQPRLYLPIIAIMIGVGMSTVKDFSVVCCNYPFFIGLLRVFSLEYLWLFIWYRQRY